VLEAAMITRACRATAPARITISACSRGPAISVLSRGPVASVLSCGLATAAVCTQLGAPLELRTDWDVPEPGSGQVKIKVAAAGINFSDILQTKGEYQDKAEVPFVPGNEAAGEVSEVGEGVEGLTVGDRVICLQRGGAFASEIVADTNTCLKLPGPAAMRADLAEAAALMVNYGTAHLALAHRAQLAPGETVLVTAAAGGVGLATVELARLLGASRVLAACGSEAKLELAAGKGASEGGINYNGLDGRAFRESLKAVTGKFGVDVVVDMVGGDLLEPCIRSLNWNGRAIVIGFTAGSIPKIPANLLLVKNVSVSGLFWGNHLIHDPKTLLGSAQQLIRWWLDGEVRPHIGARVPLARANEAFALIQGRGSTGKVVLVP